MQRTDFIRMRRSVRRYGSDPVPDDVIKDILDCGRMAPTAHNNQPWVIGAVKDPILLAKMADLVENARFIQESRVCFAVFTRADEVFYLEDGCAATMNIIYAAQAHGVATCWIAGDKKEYANQVRELLAVPVEYTLVTLVSGGYPAKVPESAKRDLDKVIFLDRYHQGPEERTDSQKTEGVAAVKRLRWAFRRWLLRRL